MDYSSNVVCRSCLCTKQKFKYFIHHNVPHQLYTFCTSVEVLQEDQLTKALCNECYKTLKKFSAFKQISIDTNLKLLSASTTCSKSNTTEDTVTIKHERHKEIYVDSNETRVKVEPIKNYSDEFEAVDCDYMYSKSLSDTEQDIIKKDAKTEEHRPKQESLTPLPKTKKPKKCMLKCKLCTTQFMDQDRFEAHLQWHNGNIVPIQCKPCNKTFNTWSGLRRHKDSAHSTVRLSSLACKLCGKVSKSKHALRSHINYHNAKMAVCHVCGKEIRQSDMKFHLSTHSQRARRWACGRCARSYLHRGALDKHVRRRHQGLRYICDKCNASFCDKHALIAHFDRHEGRKTNQCDFCEKAFYDKTSLVHHRRLHTGERPYSCSFCSKQFIAKKRLVEHLRTHSAEKPHKCHLCPQMFTQRGTLKRHLKVHAKNGPVVGNLEGNSTV